MIPQTHNSPAQETTVIRFVLENVLVASWHIIPVTPSCVMQPAIWINPEYQLRVTMGQLTNGRTAAGKVFSEERKQRRCTVAGN